MKKIFFILTAIVIIVFINICNLQSQIFINESNIDQDTLILNVYKNQIKAVLNEKTKLISLKLEFLKGFKNNIYVENNLDTSYIKNEYKNDIYIYQNILHSFAIKDSIKVFYKLKKKPDGKLLTIECKISYHILVKDNTLFIDFRINNKNELIGAYFGTVAN